LRVVINLHGDEGASAMGRLPAQWAGRDITLRIPYMMEGELILAGGQAAVQFNTALFTNNVDMPFECHRMIPRVTGMDSSSNVQPNQMTQDTLAELVRLRIADFGKSVQMTKNPTLINVITKGTSERTWEWADPYYLIRAEGFQVSVDTLTLPTWDGEQIAQNPPLNALNQLRIEINFQGFLLQVAPPSNTR
jgi:hypothetical protein